MSVVFQNYHSNCCGRYFFKGFPLPAGYYTTRLYNSAKERGYTREDVTSIKYQMGYDLDYDEWSEGQYLRCGNFVLDVQKTLYNLIKHKSGRYSKLMGGVEITLIHQQATWLIPEEFRKLPECENFHQFVTKMGFEHIKSFTNPNGGNVVHIYYYSESNIDHTKVDFTPVSDSRKILSRVNEEAYID